MRFQYFALQNKRLLICSIWKAPKFKKSTMSFPQLSYEEAIANCRELFNVDISEEDLRKPTCQFVKKLYLDIVTASMNISAEQMLQPKLKFLNTFQHPDIFEEGASFIFFTIILQRYMHTCLVTDFSIADLSNPKPKRTLHCISALVNFEKFKASQDGYFDAAMEEKETLQEQNTLLKEKNEELKQTHAQIRAAKSEDEERVQQIDRVIDNLKSAVNELNKRQASEHKETQQLKTEIAEMTSKEAELKVLIANNKEECEKFKAQIVTSPEKFRGELSRMNDAISACKDSITEKGKKLLEKKNQEESVNILEENCTQAVRAISSLEEETEKLRDLQNRLQEMHDVVTGDEEALVQKKFQDENLRRQLSLQSEKLNRLERTNEKKLSAKKDELENRKKNVESLEKIKTPCQTEISQINTEFQELMKTLSEKEDCYKNEMDAMEDAYERIIGSMNNYHGMLEDGSKRVISTLAEAEAEF